MKEIVAYIYKLSIIVTNTLGCRVENLNPVPDGMIGKSFDGGNYVKLTAKGDLTKGLIVNEWSKIWEMSLEGLFTVDFEVFGEKQRIRWTQK